MNLKNTFKALSAFAITAGMAASATGQTNLGAACGCPDVPSRATISLDTKADSDGNLTATNTVLSCDTIYTLDDKIYVGDGQSITIPPGTLIKGNLGPAGDANALIVSRGGKIFAAGTRECPIVFTAAADPLDGTYGIANKGRWGGVVLLGKAANNVHNTSGGTALGDGVAYIEGFNVGEPRNSYGAALGAEDDNDNSGIMTYVSIRHAGDIAGTANELNGLTLGSVGRGTTLEHIEIVSNLDDGIEFFGGSVDLKYGSVLFNDDDGFDWDQGWKGRGQFWVVVKTDLTTASGGDNGFELDGDDGDIALYQESPQIFNATMVGSAGINGGGVDNNLGIEWKEASRGEIYNSIFSNYNRGVQFATEATHTLDPDGGSAANEVPTDDCYAAWLAGDLILENNTFIGATAGSVVRVGGSNGSASDLAKFAADGNTDVPSIVGFNGLHVMDVNTNAITTKHDLVPSSANGPVTATPVDGFYVDAPYRGAFEPNGKSWLSDYSLRALIGLEAALVPCATDINGDGLTDVNDFLALSGAFNQTCQ